MHPNQSQANVACHDQTSVHKKQASPLRILVQIGREEDPVEIPEGIANLLHLCHHRHCHGDRIVKSKHPERNNTHLKSKERAKQVSVNFLKSGMLRLRGEERSERRDLRGVRGEKGCSTEKE